MSVFSTRLHLILTVSGLKIRQSNNLKISYTSKGHQELKSDTDRKIKPKYRDFGSISYYMSGYIDFQALEVSDSKFLIPNLDISKYRH